MTRDPQIFRKEALEHYRRRNVVSGGLLRNSPKWIGWSYRLLLAVSTAGVLFLIFGTVDEYASGPGIIRALGQIEVTAKLPGVVSSIDVVPGQRVENGEALVHFDASVEAHELEAVNRQFEIEVVKTLRDPKDQAAKQALSQLKKDRQLASMRLADKIVRAPATAFVHDIRIRPGQQLLAGEIVLTLTREDSPFRLVAALPGQYRPMIKAGTAIRLELAGYKYAYQNFVVDAIDDQIVGPTEVRRYLGPGVADAIALSGPVVLVYAQLPGNSFVAEGRTYNYYDGIQGTAQARARTTSLAVMFFPWLKVFTESGG
jgi:membrane fusion protein (multidrug efflux system)